MALTCTVAAGRLPACLPAIPVPALSATYLPAPAGHPPSRLPACPCRRSPACRPARLPEAQVQSQGGWIGGREGELFYWLFR